MTDASIIHGLPNVPQRLTGCALTIGNFDGVHLGHQRILNVARERARASGTALVAMTFEPPPDLVLRPQDPPKRLTPVDRKCRLLLDGGAGAVVIVEPTADLLSLTPEDFVQDVIIQQLAPWYVVEGPNFFFGRGRSGTIETLRTFGRRHCFEVDEVDALDVGLAEGRRRVCSTLIRSLIAAGRVADAAHCLGRPYTLFGTVIAGEGRGRVLAFPTANLPVGEQVTPADGVYAGWAEIGDERFVTAISIGAKPTFHEDTPTAIEAFCLDADQARFYDQPMALRFLSRLRAQESFDGLESLQAQIEEDVRRVRQLVTLPRV